MLETHVSDIARTIQLAIAPVFLLTALGTILGVFSNRLGRIVDRTRVLSDRMRDAQHAQQHAAMRGELEHLAGRRKLVNYAIGCATAAALFVCLLIASAFFGSLLELNVARLLATLFIVAMLAFIAALVFFLREVLVAVASTRGITEG
jgi:MFS family permease